MDLPQLSAAPQALARALEASLQAEAAGAQPAGTQSAGAQPAEPQRHRLLHPTLQFRVLPSSSGGGNVAMLLAFRERLFEDRPGGRYLPILHSTARLNAAQAGSAAATVTGYLNWTILYVIGYLVYRSAVDYPFTPVALLIGVVLLLSYAAQHSVNTRVANQIATLASGSHNGALADEKRM